MKVSFCMLVVLAVLTGCGSAPLLPITYEQPVVVQSDLDAYVELNTGRVSGHSSQSMIYAGGIFVPVSSGPVPELQFGAEDQATFIASLKAELLRLNIVRSIEEAESEQSASFVVNFVQTEHFPTYQQYKLTVSLVAELGAKSFSNRYEVLSSEGDSTWEKWNTNASKGKLKAAQKLLDLLMIDIQTFVKEALESIDRREVSIREVDNVGFEQAL